MTIRFDRWFLATAPPVFPGISVFSLLGDLGFGKDAFAVPGPVLGCPGLKGNDGQILRDSGFLQVKSKTETRDALILGHAGCQHVPGTGG